MGASVSRLLSSHCVGAVFIDSDKIISASSRFVILIISSFVHPFNFHSYFFYF